MKTRIRIAEFGDGITRYYPEVKRNLWQTIVHEFENENNRVGLIVFFPLLFVFCSVSCLFWKPLCCTESNTILSYGESVFLELDQAKKVIDDLVAKLEREKQAKIKQKLSDKIIRETYLKHP